MWCSPVAPKTTNTFFVDELLIFAWMLFYDAGKEGLCWSKMIILAKMVSIDCSLPQEGQHQKAASFRGLNSRLAFSICGALLRSASFLKTFRKIDLPVVTKLHGEDKNQRGPRIVKISVLGHRRGAINW